MSAELREVILADEAVARCSGDHGVDARDQGQRALLRAIEAQQDAIAALARLMAEQRAAIASLSRVLDDRTGHLV